MKAGHEIDVQVAERVMGLCVHEWEFRAVGEFWDEWQGHCTKCEQKKEGCRTDLQPVSGRCAPYSADIGLAMGALEHLRRRNGWKYQIHTFSDTGEYQVVLWQTIGGHRTRGMDLPLTICTALLEAKP